MMERDATKETIEWLMGAASWLVSLPRISNKGRMTTKPATMHAPLSTTGLIMPPDFPSVEHNAIHQKVLPRAQTSKDVYEQFGGAWSAQAYRFFAMTEYQGAFCDSLAKAGASPPPLERYRQERDLFGFFSNGVSVLEATFYGLFSLGAFLSPDDFPIATENDRKVIGPRKTKSAIAKAFSEDPINQAIDAAMKDPAYVDWHEIRNTLTHRAAPARAFHYPPGGAIPDQWKIKNIALDAGLVTSRRAELSRLLTTLLQGIDQFTKTRL